MIRPSSAIGVSNHFPYAGSLCGRSDSSLDLATFASFVNEVGMREGESGNQGFVGVYA